MQSIQVVSCAVTALLVVGNSAQRVLPDYAGEAREQQAPEIRREEIFVPHVSTVPANAGQTVGIAVRHITRPRGGATQGPALHESRRHFRGGDARCGLQDI
jgi:hypothetical protein